MNQRSPRRSRREGMRRWGEGVAPLGTLHPERDAGLHRLRGWPDLARGSVLAKRFDAAMNYVSVRSMEAPCAKTLEVARLHLHDAHVLIDDGARVGRQQKSSDRVEDAESERDCCVHQCSAWCHGRNLRRDDESATLSPHVI